MAVKDYPLEQWAQAIRQLWHAENCLCVLLGGQDEALSLNQLAILLKDVPHIISKPLPLIVMARVLGLTDAVLSTDTAAAHFALAQGVKTITLCGGGHPQRFLPWPRTSHGVTLIHPTPCRGCNWRCTQATNECLTNITPEQVLAAYRHLTKQLRIPLRQAG
jgi:ADP-heptose:LPS heptosyltransferase